MSDTEKLLRALIDALGYEIKVDRRYYDADTWKELEEVNGLIEYPPKSKVHVSFDYRLVKR